MKLDPIITAFVFAALASFGTERFAFLHPKEYWIRPLGYWVSFGLPILVSLRSLERDIRSLPEEIFNKISRVTENPLARYTAATANEAIPVLLEKPGVRYGLTRVRNIFILPPHIGEKRCQSTMTAQITRSIQKLLASGIQWEEILSPEFNEVAKERKGDSENYTCYLRPCPFAVLNFAFFEYSHKPHEVWFGWLLESPEDKSAPCYMTANQEMVDLFKQWWQLLTPKSESPERKI